MNDQEQMLIFAEQLWKNYFKQRVLELDKVKDGVTFFRAEVVSNPGNNRLVVQRPFDTSTMTLPCADVVADAVAGDQVMVYVHGNLSNAVVVADGLMRKF